MTTPKYPKYWKDYRSQNEIIITQKLAQKLSQINHSREKLSFQLPHQNILFILIGGVPSLPNQFVGLSFPGRVIRYYPPFFDRQIETTKLSKNQIQKKLFNVSMDNTSDQINNIIQQHESKQAIFVYHSFGGSITAWFCSKYPQKVRGLICIGGTPILFYPIIKDYTKAYLSIPGVSRQFIIENYEVVYSLYDQKTKNHSKWTRFKDKQQLLSFTLHNDPISLNVLFDKIRSLPLPILMIYGNNDAVLTKPLCSEAMVYMCYLNQSVKKDNPKLQKMKKTYQTLHSNSRTSDFNLQQMFVYFIDGGHSIHTNQKNNKLIQKLIDEYLYVILNGQNKQIKNKLNQQKLKNEKPNL